MIHRACFSVKMLLLFLSLLQSMSVEIEYLCEVYCLTTVVLLFLCMYKKEAHTFAKKDVEGPCTTTTTTEGQERIKVAFKCFVMFKISKFCEFE